MARVLACVVLGMALVSCVFAQQTKTPNDILDECEDKGWEAGDLATRSACAILTSKCPPPALKVAEARLTSAASDTVDPDDLLEQVLRDTCITLFQIICKNSATTAALEDGSDPACAAILTNGPGPGSSACPDHKSAIEIFKDSLSVCERVPSDLPNGQPEEDPCDCAEDGVSGDVDTRRKGCARHLVQYGDKDRFCYVEGGAECDGARESQRFPGAYWIFC